MQRRKKPLQTGRIVGALIIGSALIGSAYTLKNLGAESGAGSAVSDNTDSIVAVTSPSNERDYIKVTDSDSDGLHDWEEALLKDSPLMLAIQAEGDYQLPNTLTGQFSLAFFENMIQSKQSGAKGEVLATEAIASLESKAEDKLYIKHDIKTHTDNSLDALTAYGNAIGGILISNNPPNAKSELEILEIALAGEDDIVLAELDPIIAGYQAVKKDLLNLTVPAQAAKVHLDLINVIEAVTNDIKAMREVFNDPLLTMLRMKRYPDDAAGLYYALRNINALLVEFGVKFKADNSGFILHAFTSQ